MKTTLLILVVINLLLASQGNCKLNLSENYKYATEASSKLESARKLRRSGGGSYSSGGRSYSGRSSSYSSYSSSSYTSFHFNFGGRMYTYYYGYAYYGDISNPSCFPEDA